METAPSGGERTNSSRKKPGVATVAGQPCGRESWTYEHFAEAQALDGVPHQLYHFHDTREAAQPIDEADRRAKKELKERVRGIRTIERGGEGGGGGSG
jgi:hypothetical protein